MLKQCNRSASDSSGCIRACVLHTLQEGAAFREEASQVVKCWPQSAIGSAPSNGRRHLGSPATYPRSAHYWPASGDPKPVSLPAPRLIWIPSTRTVSLKHISLLRARHGMLQSSCNTHTPLTHRTYHAPAARGSVIKFRFIVRKAPVVHRHVIITNTPPPAPHVSSRRRAKTAPATPVAA